MFIFILRQILLIILQFTPLKYDALCYPNSFHSFTSAFVGTLNYLLSSVILGIIVYIFTYRKLKYLFTDDINKKYIKEKIFGGLIAVFPYFIVVSLLSMVIDGIIYNEFFYNKGLLYLIDLILELIYYYIVYKKIKIDFNNFDINYDEYMIDTFIKNTNKFLSQKNKLIIKRINAHYDEISINSEIGEYEVRKINNNEAEKYYKDFNNMIKDLKPGMSKLLKFLEQKDGNGELYYNMNKNMNEINQFLGTSYEEALEKNFVKYYKNIYYNLFSMNIENNHTMMNDIVKNNIFEKLYPKLFGARKFLDLRVLMDDDKLPIKNVSLFGEENERAYSKYLSLEQIEEIMSGRRLQELLSYKNFTIYNFDSSCTFSKKTDNKGRFCVTIDTLYDNSYFDDIFNKMLQIIKKDSNICNAIYSTALYSENFMEFYCNMLIEFNNRRKILLSGSTGESSVEEYLKTYSNDEFMYFSNVRFEVSGNSVENDFIVLTTKGIFSLEVKNYGSGGSYSLNITKDGIWTKEFKNGNVEQINSVSEQSNRHLLFDERVINRKLKEKGFKEKIDIDGIIVIANDKVDINNESNNTVIRISELLQTFKNGNKKYTKKQLKEIASVIEEEKLEIKKYDNIDYKKSFNKLIDSYISQYDEIQKGIKNCNEFFDDIVQKIL